MPRRLLRLTAVFVGLALILMLPSGVVLADCQITSSSSGNDNVSCYGSNDTNGIYTGGGNDIVVVQPGITVSNSGGDTIQTGTGTDRVDNRGTVTSGYEAVDLGTGSGDRLNNYGLIDGYSAAVYCHAPSGATCYAYNYGGTSRLNSRYEAVDLYSPGGGYAVVHNEGTIESQTQEAVHIHGMSTTTITNRGTIRSPRNAIESYPGGLTVTNSGRILSTGQSGIFGHTAADNIRNYGTIQSDRYSAIDTGGGADQIYNRGNITARANSSHLAPISSGGGNDVITNQGNISETGSGFAAIEASYGSDRVVIQGGVINDTIHGDDYNGAGSSDVDTLVFQFTGSSSEINVFRSAMASKSPREGSVTWRGNTYRWKGFERFELLLATGEGAPGGLSAMAPASPVAWLEELVG